MIPTIPKLAPTQTTVNNAIAAANALAASLNSNARAATVAPSQGNTVVTAVLPVTTRRKYFISYYWSVTI